MMGNYYNELLEAYLGDMSYIKIWRQCCDAAINLIEKDNDAGSSIWYGIICGECSKEFRDTDVDMLEIKLIIDNALMEYACRYSKLTVMIELDKVGDIQYGLCNIDLLREMKKNNVIACWLYGKYNDAMIVEKLSR